MQTTQSININHQIIQIRRIINPAKRFIIPNVYAQPYQTKQS